MQTAKVLTLLHWTCHFCRTALVSRWNAIGGVFRLKGKVWKKSNLKSEIMATYVFTGDTDVKNGNGNMKEHGRQMYLKSLMLVA